MTAGTSLSASLTRAIGLVDTQVPWSKAGGGALDSLKCCSGFRLSFLVYCRQHLNYASVCKFACPPYCWWGSWLRKIIWCSFSASVLLRWSRNYYVANCWWDAGHCHEAQHEPWHRIYAEVHYYLEPKLREDFRLCKIVQCYSAALCDVWANVIAANFKLQLSAAHFGSIP